MRALTLRHVGRHGLERAVRSRHGRTEPLGIARLAAAEREHQGHDERGRENPLPPPRRGPRGGVARRRRRPVRPCGPSRCGAAAPGRAAAGVLGFLFFAIGRGYSSGNGDRVAEKRRHGGRVLGDGAARQRLRGTRVRTGACAAADRGSRRHRDPHGRGSGGRSPAGAAASPSAARSRETSRRPPLDGLAARLVQRIARRGERQLVDHEQRQRLAGHVHPLPERRCREQHRPDLVAEALEQPLARRLALHEHLVGNAGRARARDRPRARGSSR